MQEKGLTSPPDQPITDGKGGGVHMDWSLWFNSIWFALPKVSTYSPQLDPASVAANTTAEQTFTVKGLNTRDIPVVSKPSLTAGIGIVGARVSAKDTLAITFINATGSPVDPPQEDYYILAVRR